MESLFNDLSNFIVIEKLEFNDLGEFAENENNLDFVGLCKHVKLI